MVGDAATLKVELEEQKRALVSPAETLYNTRLLNPVH